MQVGGDRGAEGRASTELHLVRLLRAAQGARGAEAAIVLLADSGVLGRLHCCITVDVERNLAWLDWEAAATMGERFGDRERALVQLACTLAEHAGHALAGDRRSLALALRHLGV